MKQWLQKLNDKTLKMDDKFLKIFVIISINSQLIYALTGLRAVMYNPMLEAFNITNTQLGLLFSINGFVATFGHLLFGWVQDRYPVKRVLALNTFANALIALFLTLNTKPSFFSLALAFFMMGFTADALYWSSVVKGIRGTATEKTQATTFGFFESFRGIVEFLSNFIGVTIFALLGGNVLGTRVAFFVATVLMFLSGVLIWIFVPDDFMKSEIIKDNKVEQKRDLKETFSGFTNSLKEPIVLLTGFSILAVYTAFIVVNVYFTPFLIDVYQLPATFVGYFALVNGAATRMLSAPFSGLIADKNFKTSAHFMKFCFVLLAMLIGGVLLVPKTQGFMYIVMLFLMASTIICYFIRGIYFAPLGEAKLPIESAAAANSIASFIGYSPTFWGYPLFGYIIDKTGSYDLIFILLIVLALFGIIINQVNGKLILNRREKTA